MSQPTAWRYMRFAAQVKAGDPRWEAIRREDRLIRRIEADEKKHGRPDLTKLAKALTILKSKPARRRKAIKTKQQKGR